jgi:MoxR-like ATPase
LVEIGEVGDAGQRILAEMRKVIVGQDQVMEELLVALLAGGHVLLEGVPGTAKTLMVQALARTVKASAKRVQFTPDLMPSDITGVNVFQMPTGTFRFQAGPVFTDLLLADEINRAPAKTQSALLEAMQEKQVTVDGKARPLPELFTVVATQNPIEYEGTYPLPEAQLDRFLCKVLVQYPTAEDEQQILVNYQAGFDASDPATFGVEAVADTHAMAAMRQCVRSVHVDEKVMAYVVELVRTSRTTPGLSFGASPRAAVMLFGASKALAALRGRGFVTPDEVKSLAPAVLRHRLMLTPEVEIEGRTSDDCIQEILSSTEVPR